MVDSTKQITGDVRELVEFALEILPTMYEPDAGLFCVWRDLEGRRHGLSERYTLMCIIGLCKARAAGYEIAYDLKRLYETVARRAASNAADLGLLLWAGSLIGHDKAGGFYAPLTATLGSDDIDRLTGIELGLALSGLVALYQHGGAREVTHSAAVLSGYIAHRCVHHASGLFYHTGGESTRRSFPNFATQVYLMQAMAQYARATGERDPVRTAARCAEALRALQRPDGGWPWIYQAKGRVVEPYEIYSVHQDAMAPMALLEAGEAASQSYRDMIERGLKWLYSGNELGADMIDREHQTIYRSIRRRAPFDRLLLGLNTASSKVLGRPLLGGSGPAVELNTVCRPYHPGWILQAWCGREAQWQSGS